MASGESGNGQEALWNGEAGRAWVEAQALLDRMFMPFEERLVEAVSAASATAVLDVGCGTGSTTLAVARLLDGAGPALGVDISAPMIALAQARAAREGVRAAFIRADAQTHAFEPESFGMVVSRFGVMFFEDPVAAFTNLRGAVQPGGPLHLFAWRSPEENTFMTAAERAAAPLLPALPPRRPHAPGQFAFADPRRVRRILEQSGWTAIDVSRVDIACAFPESELENYFTRLGPVGLAIADLDERTRAEIVEIVRRGFDPFLRKGEVRFTAACWAVGARSPNGQCG